MKSYSMDLAGRTLTVDIDRVGKQANGCAFMHYGETTVLCTATASDAPREGVDFFPCSVEYEEKTYSVGKIPGGFNKREGRASENSSSYKPCYRPSYAPLISQGFQK
jgi:polyribonucleotide nucleotidyltransferase